MQCKRYLQIVSKHGKCNKIRTIPALAGIVQGVVVHTAKHKSGNSFSRELDVKGALTTLKMAYMLLETCFSGYYIEINEVAM